MYQKKNFLRILIHPIHDIDTSKFLFEAKNFFTYPIYIFLDDVDFILLFVVLKIYIPVFVYFHTHTMILKPSRLFYFFRHFCLFSKSFKYMGCYI